MDRQNNVNNVNDNTANTAYPAYSGYAAQAPVPAYVQPQVQQQQMQEAVYAQQPQQSQQVQYQGQGQAPQQRRRYLPVEVGRCVRADQSGQETVVPYAFHLECTVTQPPHFFPAADGKPAAVSINVALGAAPERIMALADGSYVRGQTYGDGRQYGEVTAHGQLAEALSAFSGGDTFAVCGPVAWRNWTSRDGRTGRTFSVAAEYVQLTRSKHYAPAVQPGFVPAVKLWTDRNGQERRDPTVCLVTATVVSAPGQVYTSGNGVAYLPLQLSLQLPARQLYDAANGVNVGDYPDYRTVKAVLFDRTATALAGRLREGTQVCLTGTISEDTYQGQSTGYTIRPRVLTILTYTAGYQAAPAASYGAPAQAAAPVPTGTGYAAAPASAAQTVQGTGYGAAPATAPAPQGAPSGYAAAPAQPAGYAAAPATQTASAQPYKADAADQFTDLQTGDDDLPF